MYIKSQDFPHPYWYTQKSASLPSWTVIQSMPVKISLRNWAFLINIHRKYCRFQNHLSGVHRAFNPDRLLPAVSSSICGGSLRTVRSSFNHDWVFQGYLVMSWTENIKVSTQWLLNQPYIMATHIVIPNTVPLHNSIQSLNVWVSSTITGHLKAQCGRFYYSALLSDLLAIFHFPWCSDVQSYMGQHPPQNHLRN